MAEQPRYHTCGAEIWMDARWNGIAYVTVFSDADGETNFCPRCGEWLSMEVLSEHPPERDNGDLVARLLEALEMTVEAIANSDAKFCADAIKKARAAIEAAKEGGRA